MYDQILFNNLDIYSIAQYNTSGVVTIPQALCGLLL